MIHNFIGATASNGGASTLTLTAVEGLALPSAAFVNGQTVQYSIVEYTDATLSVLSKAESGFGQVSNTNVLTRSRPSETWSAGAFNQANPSALNFGTSNVRVYLTAIAEGGPTAYPARANFSALYGPDQFLVPSNMVNTGDMATSTLDANTLYMVPIRLDAGFALTSLGVNVSTPAAGKLLSACIASIDPITGQPGVVLQAINGLSMASTGMIAGTVTGRILAPGWYYACFTSDGTPTIMGSDTVGPTFLGTNGARLVRYVNRPRPYANFTAGVNPMAGATGSAGFSGNAAAPTLIWK